MYEVRLNRISKSLALDIPNVRKVNLSGLAMNMVPFDNIPDTVEEVDLSNNRFSKIPARLLTKRFSLSLAGNPIKCDCWHKDFIGALQVTKKKHLFIANE